jgi:hypothetical protein
MPTVIGERLFLFIDMLPMLMTLSEVFFRLIAGQ